MTKIVEMNSKNWHKKAIQEHFAETENPKLDVCIKPFSQKEIDILDFVIIP